MSAFRDKLTLSKKKNVPLNRWTVEETINVYDKLQGYGVYVLFEFSPSNQHEYNLGAAK